MHSSKHAVNQFMRLPEAELNTIREYFLKSEFAGAMGFGQYLEALCKDDLSPAEVLDVIAAHGDSDYETFSSVEDLLADLKK